MCIPPYLDELMRATGGHQKADRSGQDLFCPPKDAIARGLLRVCRGRGGSPVKLELGEIMKKNLMAVVVVCSTAAAWATDWGFLTAGVQYGFTATGVFMDVAKYAANGDFTVTVTGTYSVRCTGGRGANCLYNVADINSIGVVDGGGNPVCDPIQVGSNPDKWSCATSGVQPANYTILIDGNAHQHTKIVGSDKPATEAYYVLVN